MHRGRRIFLTTVMLLATLFVLFATTDASLVFSGEELEYLEKAPILKIAYFDQAAPLIYKDNSGNPRGISKEVVDLIAEKSGLQLEYVFISSPSDLEVSSIDLLVGISPEYAPQGVLLSQPYLRVESVLYMHKNVKPDQLRQRWFSAVQGVSLPPEIDPNYVKYFETREKSLTAVEKGKADYGYANIFSIAYYTIKNNYKNIVSIPHEKEVRYYSVGILNDDRVLLAIINKVIESLDDNTLSSLIIQEASQIERRITIPMIIDTYGKWILLISLIIVVILLVAAISTYQANSELVQQNIRYEALSQISNEYLYEYKFKSRELVLSQQCHRLFGTSATFKNVKVLLKDALSNLASNTTSFLIYLPLLNGELGTFKVVTLNLIGSESMIGKLIDVSEDIAEKRELLTRSQIDGLSGVLNATATKEAIFQIIEERVGKAPHYFLLLDIDNFKEINDTYGHLEGDQVLGLLGRTLKETFIGHEVIGRIGGDEFCVYISNANLVEEVLKKSANLVNNFKQAVEIGEVSLSMGVCEVKPDESFETFFKRSDAALYRAKLNGKDQIVVG